MTTEARWKQRPPGSNWGDFGADDQCGRINLLTPDKVRQGVAEVHEGLTFCLSLPLDLPGGNVLNPRRHPPVLRPTLRNGRPNMNYRLFTDNPLQTDVISDDLAVLHLQYSTQWDSLAHVGQLFDANGDGLPEAVYYNGFRADEDVVGPEDAGDAGVPPLGDARSTSKARALGIENMAERCVQGRGVMVDLQAHVGAGRVAVGYDTLMRVLDADRITVETGDMVCLHTGFARRCSTCAAAPMRPCSSKPAPCSMAATRSCCNGSPIPASRCWRRTTTRWSFSPPRRGRPRRTPCCRCTNTACSRTASTSASCGISRR